MSEKSEAGVYDIETGRLVWRRWKELRSIENFEQEFDRLKVPRFGRFDIYTPDRDDSSYAIILRASQNTEGRSFLARLDYSGLNKKANIKRKLSPKYRTLFVGPLTKET